MCACDCGSGGRSCALPICARQCGSSSPSHSQALKLDLIGRAAKSLRQGASSVALNVWLCVKGRRFESCEVSGELARLAGLGKSVALQRVTQASWRWKRRRLKALSHAALKVSCWYIILCFSADRGAVMCSLVEPQPRKAVSTRWLAVGAARSWRCWKSLHVSPHAVVLSSLLEHSYPLKVVSRR